MVELINEDLILLDIELKSKEDIINIITSLLEKANRINNREVFIKDIYKREEEVPTSMGMKEEVIWNDEDRVKFIFGIAVPKENEDNIHLKILSSLARKLINREYIELLGKVKDKQECVELISFGEFNN